MSKSLRSPVAVLAAVCAGAAVGLVAFAFAVWLLTGSNNGVLIHAALATGAVAVAVILIRFLPSARPAALAFAVAFLGCLGFSFWGYPALLNDKARLLAADDRYCLANSESLLPLAAKEDLSLLTIEKWWGALRPYRYPFSGVSQGVVLAIEVGDPVPDISDGLEIYIWDVSETEFVPYTTSDGGETYRVYHVGCLPDENWLEQEKDMTLYGVIMGQHRLTIPEKFNPEFRSNQMSITARGPDFEAMENIRPEDRFYSTAMFVERQFFNSDRARPAEVLGVFDDVATRLFFSKDDSVEWSEIAVDDNGLRSLSPDQSDVTLFTKLSGTGSVATAIVCDVSTAGRMCTHRFLRGLTTSSEVLSVTFSYPESELENWQEIERRAEALLQSFGFGITPF